MIKVEVEDR